MEETTIEQKKKWTSNLKKFITNNKLITITATVFTFCFILNVVLILNFMKLLETV